MITIRCPKCSTTASVAAELAGKTYRCLNCQAMLGVPAPVTAVPPRPAPPPEDEVLVLPPEAISEPISIERTFEDFLKHKTVKQELDRLDALKLPKFKYNQPPPLPLKLPTEAEKLGPTIAMHGSTSSRVIYFFAVAAMLLGLALLGLGIFIIVNNPNAAGRNWRSTLIIGIMCCAGASLILLIGAGLALYARYYARSLKLTYWICDKGLIWTQGEQLRWCRWSDIHEAYVRTKVVELHKKVYGITHAIDRFTEFTYQIKLGDNLATLEGEYRHRNPLHHTGYRESTGRFANYVISKASQAYFPIALRQIFEGETVQFGDLEFDLRGFHFKDEAHDWSQVKSVKLVVDDDEQFLIEFKVAGQKEAIIIGTNNVSLPEAAVSVARVYIKLTPKIEPGLVVSKPMKPESPFDFGP